MKVIIIEQLPTPHHHDHHERHPDACTATSRLAASQHNTTTTNATAAAVTLSNARGESTRDNAARVAHRRRHDVATQAVVKGTREEHDGVAKWGANCECVCGGWEERER